MTRARRRDVVLSSAVVILVATALAWWSYRGLAPPEEMAPVTSTSTTSTTSPLPPDVGQLALYIDDHFSEAPWYQSIGGYEQLGLGGVAVRTSLTRAATEPALGICRAVSFWRPGDDLRVVVQAGDGATIVESPAGSGADRCQAVT